MRAPRTRLRWMISQALTWVITLSFALADATAAIRTSGSTYSTINNASVGDARRPFVSSGRGAAFRIARGVLLAGRATFVLDAPSGQTPVDPQTVRLSVGRDGQIFILHREIAYRLDGDVKLACSLARFVERRGEIIYSLVPPDLVDQLTGTGLVRGRSAEQILRYYNQNGGPDELQQIMSEPAASRLQEWYAAEFSNTDFAPLLLGSDLTEDVTSLPDEISRRVMPYLRSDELEVDRFSEDYDLSYINSDHLVTYKVYLVSQSQSVDIEGVPLRIHWESNGGDANIRFVQVFDDAVSSDATFTKFTHEGPGPSKYDVILLYQTTGIFREMYARDPQHFLAFRESVCQAR